MQSRRDDRNRSYAEEFVVGINTTGRRESMTAQIAAAAVALVLGEDRRRNGRWQYGQLSNSEDLANSEGHLKALRQCGLILDTLGPDAPREVRDG